MSSPTYLNIGLVDYTNEFSIKNLSNYNSTLYFDGTALTSDYSGFSTIVTIGIGSNAIKSNPGTGAIAIGSNAGTSNTQPNSVAIGVFAAYNSGGSNENSVAIGYYAGYSNQQSNSVAIGYRAGSNLQGCNAIAIGTLAGMDQSNAAIAIGCNSGSYVQGYNAISIGTSAGYYIQGFNSIAIGCNAGYTNQSPYSIAIGTNTSATGSYGVAIGGNASSATNNSIVLNASGSVVTSQVDGAFYVKPLRSLTPGTNVVSYDTTTSELFYASILSIQQLNATLGVQSNGTFLTSDSNLKENISSADLGLCYQTMKDLPLRRFTYISSIADTKLDASQIGFIAQEVYPIFPKSIYSTFHQELSTSILNLNYDQIFMSHFGATQLLISTTEGLITQTQQQESSLQNLVSAQSQQESTLQGQTLELETLLSSYQTLVTQISSSVMN
jgi:hypothetical protein